MPAEIDTMMYVNEVPWHRLGKRLENPATATEAIDAAGLGWDVQLQPLYTGPDRAVKVKDRFAVCRIDRLDHADGGQLGIVGRDYTPLQNREAFNFLDPLVGENAAIYHTAGSLRDGRRVWMLAKLPGEIRVIGDDIAEKYLLLSNSHDGGSSVRIGLPHEIRPFSRTQARAVWAFVRLHRPDIGAIVVHCEQGVSRSPAIAAALARYLQAEERRFRQQYQPNCYVYGVMVGAMPERE